MTLSYLLVQENTTNPLQFHNCNMRFGSRGFSEATNPAALFGFTASKRLESLIRTYVDLKQPICSTCSCRCPRLSSEEKELCSSPTSPFFETQLRKHVQAFVCLEFLTCYEFFKFQYVYFSKDCPYSNNSIWTRL